MFLLLLFLFRQFRFFLFGFAAGFNPGAETAGHVRYGRKTHAMYRLSREG